MSGTGATPPHKLPSASAEKGGAELSLLDGTEKSCDLMRAGVCNGLVAFRLRDDQRQRRSAMPLYFFDVHNGVIHEDDTGTECSNLRAAQSAAVQLSGELLRESPEEYRSTASWIVRVRDAAGCIVFSLRLQADGALKAKAGLH